MSITDTLNTNGNTGRRFVSVPIPEEYVVHVMSYVAQLDAGATAAMPSAAAAAPEEEKEEDLPTATAPVDEQIQAWPMEDLTRLASGANFTTQLLGEVLDVLADRPEEWLNLDDLAKLTGRDRPTLKGIWTHVGRHIKNSYNGRVWPHDAQWGPHLSSSKPSVTFYRLSSEQAKRWKEARQSAA